MSDPNQYPSRELPKQQEPQPEQPACCPMARGGRSWMLWGLLIALFGVYLISNRQASVASAVPWQEDLTAALGTAKEKHQPLLIKFHAPWCGYCKQMDREVFSRQDVAQALSNWVTVSIDGDRQPEVVDRYKIESYPTFVLLDSDGQEAFRINGAVSADEFIRQVQVVAKALGAQATRSM